MSENNDKQRPPSCDLERVAEATVAMSDGLEELWDVVDLTSASQETKDAHAVKKAVRAGKLE